MSSELRTSGADGDEWERIASALSRHGYIVDGDEEAQEIFCLPIYPEQSCCSYWCLNRQVDRQNFRNELIGITMVALLVIGITFKVYYES